jgi:hypothetical protein
MIGGYNHQEVQQEGEPPHDWFISIANLLSPCFFT